MTGVLELADEEFKAIMISMPRALMDRQQARTDQQCKQRQRNQKKELKTLKC